MFGFFEGFVLHEKNRIALPQYLLRSSGGGVAVYNNVLFHAMEVNNLVVCTQYMIRSSDDDIKNKNKSNKQCEDEIGLLAQVSTMGRGRDHTSADDA